MHRILVNHNKPYYGYPKSEHLKTEVKQIMLSCAGDPPDLEMLASAFGISGRSLRRQLSEAGTSYQKILNSARCQLATQYLQTTSMSTLEISEQLGFTDVSNFRHAFKRWVGISPAAFRSDKKVA